MGKKFFNDRQSYILTRETLGTTLLLFCAIVTVILLTNKLVFGAMGAAICTFMYGTFGYGSFLVVASLAYFGIWLVFEKKLKIKLRPMLFVALTCLCLFLLFHSVSTRDFPLDSYGAYLSECYLSAAEGFSGYTFGGVISGLIVYPIAKVMTFIAAYVIFAVLSILCGYVTFVALRNVYLGNTVAQSANAYKGAKEEVKPAQPEVEQVSDNLYSVNENHEIVSTPRMNSYPQYARQESVQPHSATQPVSPVQPTMSSYGGAGRTAEQREADEDRFSREKLGKKILFEPGEFAAESYRRNMIYNESSYFNHPVRGNDDYWKSFSSGKTGDSQQSQAQSAQGGTTYTQSFAKNAESSPASGNAPTYIYGDNPVSNLSAPDSDSSAYNSYSVGGAQSQEVGQAEEESDVNAESVVNSDDVSVIRDDAIASETPSQPQDDAYDVGARSADIAYRQSIGGVPSRNAESSFGQTARDERTGQQPGENTPGQATEYNFGQRVRDNRSIQQPAENASGQKTEYNFGQIIRDNGARQQSGENSFRQSSENAFGQSLRENGIIQQSGDNNFRQSDDNQARGMTSDNRAALNSFGGESRVSDSRRPTEINPRSVQSDRRTEELGGTGGASTPVQPEQTGRQEPSRGDRNSIFNLFNSSNPRLSSERNIEPDVSALSSRDRSRENVGERNRENIFDDNDDGTLFGRSESETRSADTGVGGLRGGASERINSVPSQDTSVRQEPPVQPVQPQPIQQVQRGDGFGDRQQPEATPMPATPEPVKEEEPPKPKHIWKKYVRPTLDLLDDYPENSNVNTAEIEESKQIICDTLEGFRIASEISNVVVGPAITRYDVIIKDKTNIKNALKYRESIAMALMKENVNAYLNYSKGAISVEVPNSSRSIVGLKGILASSQFINSKPNSLCFAFGKNVEGKVVCPDITKMPHLLVAGTTGSGKSICLSALIVSLLYKYGPEDLRFILVDPKQVEFISYDKLPHLMINEIIYDVDKAIKALNWAIKEMERRYQLFKEMTEKGIATKNLNEYNAHLEEGEEKLPKIVIILDEFGDLMLQAKKDIEGRIIRLVQKARACGIHLILATQRPSVDCITGLIKSNLPTRIGFKVNSFDDSRCIFDIGGAEKLLGKGDCYFRSAESPELARIQGCFIDTHEVQRVTDFVKHNNETYFDQSVSDFINTVEEPQESSSEESSGGVETKIDDTFIKALKFCVTSNQASVSMIQRRFPIGYMKACKIIDWMENMNYVTQSEGSKPRKVLLSKEEFIKTYGEIDD